MNKKLTLKLDAVVIDQAKQYAEVTHESVSNIVERYLKSLISIDYTHHLQKTNAITELSGVIKLPDNYDEKSDFFLSKMNS